MNRKITVDRWESNTRRFDGNVVEATIEYGKLTLSLERYTSDIRQEGRQSPTLRYTLYKQYEDKVYMLSFTDVDLEDIIKMTQELADTFHLDNKRRLLGTK